VEEKLLLFEKKFALSLALVTEVRCDPGLEVANIGFENELWLLDSQVV
jgi:hypothetical protein